MLKRPTLLGMGSIGCTCKGWGLGKLKPLPLRVKQVSGSGEKNFMQQFSFATTSFLNSRSSSSSAGGIDLFPQTNKIIWLVPPPPPVYTGSSQELISQSSLPSSDCCLLF